MSRSISPGLGVRTREPPGPLRRHCGVEMGTLRSHARRSAQVSVLTLALLVSACSQSTGMRSAAEVTPPTHMAPLTDASLTPQGWSAIGLGDIEISVPSDWLIEDPGLTCGNVQGTVFINETPEPFPRGMGCPVPANVIEMSTARPIAHRDPYRTVINDMPATEETVRIGSTSDEVVRALDGYVDARGPLAMRVVATLTHSPLSVVLDSSVNSIPAHWHRVTFGGLRFAVPKEWAVERETSWGGCPYNIDPDVLELSTAQYFFAPACPAPPETANYLAASPGMVLGSGPLVATAPADASCLSRNGLRICIDPPPPPRGGFAPGHELDLLTAQVRVPDQATVDQVEIGLTGTGVTPLQIFDSLEPAE
jgi:hypothetical protein